MEYRNVIGNVLTKTPEFGRFVFGVKRAVRGAPGFRSSAEYWDENYRRGGSSGPGSYGRLAAFKAEVLNRFVADNDIKSVIEFGSGDGAQLNLARYRKYTGVDVSHSALESTRRRFANDESVRFLHTSEVGPDDRAELSLSLDVVYHLVEDDQFDAYMRQLYSAATRFVVVYSSNEDKKWPSPHVRHRRFTRWVEANQPGFELVQRIPNRYPFSVTDPDNTSFADFFIFARLL